MQIASPLSLNKNDSLKGQNAQSFINVTGTEIPNQTNSVDQSFFFVHQLMHKRNALKNNIKTYIKTAPAFFDVTVTPSSGSALFVLAKVPVVKIVN